MKKMGGNVYLLSHQLIFQICCVMNQPGMVHSSIIMHSIGVKFLEWVTWITAKN